MKSTLFYLRVMNRKNWRGTGGHGAQATRSPQVQCPAPLQRSCWFPVVASQLWAMSCLPASGGSTGGPAASDPEKDLSLLLTEGHLLWDMVGGRQVQEARATCVLHQMLQQTFTLFLTGHRVLPQHDPAGQTPPRGSRGAGILDTCVVPAMGEGGLPWGLRALLWP